MAWTLSGALAAQGSAGGVAAIDAPAPAAEESSSCAPDWIPTFGGPAGTNNIIRAMTVFDDGSGPALHVAGAFSEAGGESAARVARWDGEQWAALGAGIQTSPSGPAEVLAMAVFDDGAGPALFVAGNFTHAGGAPAMNIARWDGVAWSALGAGLDNIVNSLQVFDDGSGPALYAGGWFTSAGGAPASRIAKWDGSSWSALGEGLGGTVFAMTVFTDLYGEALFAGGRFNAEGGGALHYIARWDGASWLLLPNGPSNFVYSLAVYDDGQGPALYAGGSFSSAGTATVKGIARWDGVIWSALGSGLSTNSSAELPTVRSMTVHDDGSGPALHVVGRFDRAGGQNTKNVARWDGSAWSGLASGVAGLGVSVLRAITAFDEGEGPQIFVGGNALQAGGVPIRYLARWNGEDWLPEGEGVGGTVMALLEHDDGSGPALFAGGFFVTAGGERLDRIARWDGSEWSDVGGGVGEGSGSGSQSVQALEVYDDGAGAGPALFAGGQLSRAGSAPVKGIGRWDGVEWADVGGGVTHQVGVSARVRALRVFDDGTGPALYAGGDFLSAGGVSAAFLARWDGATWSPVDGSPNSNVHVLEVYDDGAGPALYVGGEFTLVGGQVVNRIARWDGSAWEPLGGGADDAVFALVVHDDGEGPALFAGGAFGGLDGVFAPGVARWRSGLWSSLGAGTNGAVRALAVHDGGDGPALFVGGSFTLAGGADASRVARWDGAWSALGAGADDHVHVLGAFDTGAGSRLHVGGTFHSSGAGDARLATWGGCAGSVGVPLCFGSRDLCPCGNAGGPAEGCASSIGSGAVLSAIGSASVAADDLRLTGGQLVPGGSALLFVGDAVANGGAGLPFGDGLRCATGSTLRLGTVVADDLGTARWGPGLAAASGMSEGDVGFYQVWYRDPGASPCGSGFNLSHALQVVFGL